MLDELGASKPHPWVLDVLYSLLNTRYNRKKVTVATSNFEDELDASARRARAARGPHRLPAAQPPLRDVPDGPAAGRRLPQGRPGHPDPVPVLRPALPARSLALSALAAAAPGRRRACRRPKPVRPGAAPAPVEAPVPAPARARRGAGARRSHARASLYRVGLKSDLTEFSIGSAGTLWIVASGDRAELLQGPDRLPARAAPAGAAVLPGPGRRLLAGGAGAERSPSGSRRGSQRPRPGRLLGRPGALPRAPRRLSPRAPTPRRCSRRLKARGQDGFVVPGAPRAGRGGSGLDRRCGRRPARTLDLRLARRRLSGPRRTCASPSTASPYRGSLRVARESARDAERRQPRRPRGVPLRGRARRDGPEALRRDRGAEGAGRRGAHVRPRAPRAVRGRGLRHLPGPEVPGLRRLRRSRTRSRRRPSTARAGSCSPTRGSSPTRSSSRRAAASRRTSRTSSRAVPCPTSSRSSAASSRARRSRERAVRARRRRRAHRRSSGAGYVLRRLAPRKAAARAASLETAQKLGGRAAQRASPPAKLTPAAVYPSLVAAFDLTEARALQLTPRRRGLLRRAPARGPRPVRRRPAARTSSCCGSASPGDALPPAGPRADRGGVRRASLFSIALRTLGVTEG